MRLKLLPNKDIIKYHRYKNIISQGKKKRKDENRI
jgi:hypothetical protein